MKSLNSYRRFIRRRKTMVFLLSLIGAVCWGISPIFAKVGLQYVNPMIGLTVRTLVTASLVTSWMLLDGSIVQFRNIAPFTVFLLATEAVLSTLLGDLAYFAAIKKGSVSLVTTVMAASPLFTILCAALFLGETMTLQRLIGACIIIFGVILVI